MKFLTCFEDSSSAGVYLATFVCLRALFRVELEDELVHIGIVDDAAGEFDDAAGLFAFLFIV